jgi:hypothetical protein
VDEADQPLRVSRRINAQAAHTGLSRVNKTRAMSRSEADCDWMQRVAPPAAVVEAWRARPGDRVLCGQPPGGCHLCDEAQTQPNKAHDLVRAEAERINVGVRRAGALRKTHGWFAADANSNRSFTIPTSVGMQPGCSGRKGPEGSPA